jgi:hypothetical protein
VLSFSFRLAGILVKNISRHAGGAVWQNSPGGGCGARCGAESLFSGHSWTRRAREFLTILIFVCQ